MNHQYRLVWNNINACWQAVAETARGKGKTKSIKANPVKHNNSNFKATHFKATQSLALKLNIKALSAITALAFSANLFAEPLGGNVTAGAGTITQQGAVTTINQATQNMAIDWHSFNIRANEAVRFNQPNANAIALNRITGTEPSSIMGSLSANGKVFILNPNGILFGAGSQVNVGGLVASTLNLSNENFLKGNFNFTGNGTGTITNLGNITVPQGGTVAFIAPVIKNSGSIVAQQGKVLLAAADDVTLTLQDGNLVSYTLNKGSVQTLIDNGGLIQADGGHVVLTAKGLDALSKSVINHTGIIEAQTVSSKDGKIELLGDMQIGTLNMAGKIDASAPASKNPYGGNGGFVETSAAKVKIADSARVTTLAANGENGTWLIDPTDFTVAATGGDMTGQAVTNALAGGNFIIDSDNGAGGTGGNVYINDAISWSANTLRIDADNNIYINKNLNGSGNAMLAFNYGLGTADGGTSDYFINGAKINLPEGLNFGTKKGLNGAFTPYQVITRLGVEGDASSNTLQGIENNYYGKYVLGSDIDATETINWNAGAGFNPISAHNGVLEGFNHVIKNLYINRPTEDEVGLFGGQFYGIIQNIGLINVNINGGFATGGLVAGFNSGLITNVFLSGIVKGNIQTVGGLIGFSSGEVNNVYSSANVSGNSQVGGLIGSIATGNVTDSYATGNVSGSGQYVGGFAGLSSGSVSNAFSTGIVNSSSSNVGGLIGLNSGVVNNSYSLSKVSGSNSVGGLIGYNDFGDVSTSYANSDVVGIAKNAGFFEGKYIGGLIGFNQGKISNSYASGTVNGDEYIGGLVGYNYFGQIANSYSTSVASGRLSFGTITGVRWSDAVINSFYENQTVTTPYPSGIGLNVAQMQSIDTYKNVGWDISDQAGSNSVWRISPGDYPRLRALTQGTIVVDTPNLGLAGPNVSKVYDGIAVNTIQDLSTLNGWLPAYNGLTVTGLQDGDSLTNTSIFSGLLKYGGSWEGAKNAGSYTIVPSGIQSQKYEIVYTNGSLNITPRPLTATITGNIDKVYDGTTDAVFNWNQIQLNGFAPNEGGRVVCIGCITEGGLYSSKNAGVRAVEANFIDDDIIPNQNTLLSNYILPEVATGTGEITPRPLILQALDTDRYYGKPNPYGTSVISVPSNNGQLSGLVLGERIDGIDFTFANTATLNASPYSQHDINISNAHFAEGNSSNYAIQYLPAKLTVLPDANKNFRYWTRTGLNALDYEQFLKSNDELNNTGAKKLYEFASAVYDSQGVIGYSIIDRSPTSLTGFNGVAYKNDNNQIVIAFSGSKSPSDWYTNASQVLGNLPKQYIEALNFTELVRQQNPTSTITLVGHSLGGGVAMFVAGATGLSATTFNPAKLDSSNFEKLKSSTQFSALQNVNNYVFDNEFVQKIGDQYYGSLNLIQVGTEGTLDDHGRVHIEKVIQTLSENAVKRLQPDYNIAEPLTGAGSTFDNAITYTRNNNFGVSVIFTNPNDGISNFINTNDVLMTESPYSTLLEYYFKREFGGDALQAYRDRQAIVDAEYSINAADVFPDSLLQQNIYRVAQGFQASSHWLLGVTDAAQTAVSAVDPTTYATISAKALFVGTVIRNFQSELSVTELNEITELIEASIDATGALRALQGHADDAIRAEAKLAQLKSKSSFYKYSKILKQAKSEILLDGLGSFSEIVGPYIESVTSDL